MNLAVMPVSRASQIPLYHQVANDIRQRIVSGVWGVGDRIPSEPELTQMYRASRMTIRQALALLAREGLVSRQPGRGSFVIGPQITAGPTRLTSFTAEMRDKGLKAWSDVLAFELVRPDADVSSALGLPETAEAIRLERLRYGDDQPLGLQSTWLPADRFPNFLAIDFSSASLYEELEQRFATVIDEAIETYTATILESGTAELLHTGAGTAGFVVERVAFSAGEAVEYTRSIMRGDRYRVQMRLQRATRAAEPER